MPTSTSTQSDLLSCSSEPAGRAPRSETTERRGVLPGLPGGPGLGEPEPVISEEVLDALLAGASTAGEIAGPDGVLAQLTRRLLNRALEVELTEHLGYPPGQAPPGGAGNARNGRPSKTVLSDQGPLRIRSPRDRRGTFEPQIVKKRQTRWVGFDEKVISLYARGLTVREIQGHLAEIYGTEVSPDLISKITDAVLGVGKAWQNRPLERLYPIVYLDALVVKIRDGQAVRNFACYVAIGVNLQGERDVLGIWLPKDRGREVLDAGADRAGAARCRRRADLLCRRADRVPRGDRGDLPSLDRPDGVVHQVRSSLKFVSYKDERVRRRPQTDLHRGRPGPRRRRAAGVRREMGRPLPDDQQKLARALGTDHPLPGLPPGRPPRDLHDQLDRGAAPPDPQDHQDTRALPDRGRRPQAALPRDHQGRDPLAASGSLALGARSFQHPLPRPHSRQ